MSVGYTTAKRIQVLTGHKKGHVSGLATASEGVLKHREKRTAQKLEEVKVRRGYDFKKNSLPLQQAT
jgi:hypothetical protein